MFHVWSYHFIALYFFIGMTLNPSLGWAKGPDLKAFNSYVEQKQYSDALIELQKIRENQAYTYSPDLIYNLGLIEWNLKQFGPAIAHFRLAQHLQPFSSQKLKTLNWAYQQLEDNQRLYVRREPLLFTLSQYLTTQVLFTFSLIALAAMTIAAMRISEGEIFKQSRVKTALVLGFFSCLLFVLSFVSFNFQSKIFATQILDEETTVFAGPSNKSASLGSLTTGDAVEVLKKTDTWWHISTTDIPSGWVKAASLQVHSRLD